MKKLLLTLGLGAGLFIGILVFGLGYFLYSLIPGNSILSNWHHEWRHDNGVMVYKSGGVRIGKDLSPECLQLLEKITQDASLWDLFRAGHWQQVLSEKCLHELEPIAPNNEANPYAPKMDLEWDHEDNPSAAPLEGSEVI